FGGAFASTLIVFGLARGSGAWSPTRVLLTGVIVAAGCGAIVALLLSLAPEAQLRGMLFWLIGDLSSPPSAWAPLLVVAIGITIGHDQRIVLPASTLAGGVLLLVADTLARQIAAPVQLPVGVITALIGVPVFLWLLARGSAVERQRL